MVIAGRMVEKALEWNANRVRANFCRAIENGKPHSAGDIMDFCLFPRRVFSDFDTVRKGMEYFVYRTPAGVIEGPHDAQPEGAKAYGRELLRVAPGEMLPSLITSVHELYETMAFLSPFQEFSLKSADGDWGLIAKITRSLRENGDLVERYLASQNSFPLRILGCGALDSGLRGQLFLGLKNRDNVVRDVNLPWIPVAEKANFLGLAQVGMDFRCLCLAEFRKHCEIPDSTSARQYRELCGLIGEIPAEK